jgi:putative spermidine/putrescine transport system permease protein
MSDSAVAGPALRQSLGWLSRVNGVAVGLVAVYLLAPILIVFPMSLTRSMFLTWPPDVVSLNWFTALLEDDAWTGAFWRSIKIAVPVALFSTVLGTAAAVGLAYTTRWRRPLQTLFVAPLILPVITYALGLYDVSERFGMVGSVWPVIIGQAMLAMPLVVIVVSAGLAGRDPTLPRAAASLGASWARLLWTVELPLVRGSVLAGFLLAFAYSFDEIIVAYFLSPPGGGTLPVEILASTQDSASPIVAAASVLVIGVATLVAGLILVARMLLRTPR